MSVKACKQQRMVAGGRCSPSSHAVTMWRSESVWIDIGEFISQLSTHTYVHIYLTSFRNALYRDSGLSLLGFLCRTVVIRRTTKIILKRGGSSVSQLLKHFSNSKKTLVLTLDVAAFSRYSSSRNSHQQAALQFAHCSVW